MAILLIRHAPAGDKVEWKKNHDDDSARPLTPKGKKKFSQVSRAFKQLCPKLAEIYSSPYIRARQTAEILQEEFPRLKIKLLTQAFPGMSFIQECVEKKKVVAYVGHEPTLSMVLEKLVGAELTFEKGGAALIRKTEKGLCLEFFMGTKALKRLATKNRS